VIPITAAKNTATTNGITIDTASQEKYALGTRDLSINSAISEIISTARRIHAKIEVIKIAK